MSFPSPFAHRLPPLARSHLVAAGPSNVCSSLGPTTTASTEVLLASCPRMRFRWHGRAQTGPTGGQRRRRGTTNLARKGGDDRNISIYFVFLPEDIAASMEGANIRQLNGDPNVRILQYVWGGNHSRGALQNSPYAPGQGANVILRSAGTGSHSESVNLASDFSRAFGGAPGALVGIAVSADSDDTGSSIRASVSGLSIR